MTTQCNHSYYTSPTRGGAATNCNIAPPALVARQRLLHRILVIFENRFDARQTPEGVGGLRQTRRSGGEVREIRFFELPQVVQADHVTVGEFALVRIEPERKIVFVTLSCVAKWRAGFQGGVCCLISYFVKEHASILLTCSYPGPKYCVACQT